jgi:predicted nucleic acid-binding protein
VRIVVDTGVFSASISRRRRARFETQVGLMTGQQVFLAAVTVAELRYGALVAGWGEQRRQRLEQSIAATTVVPVSDALLTTGAELRHAWSWTSASISAIRRSASGAGSPRVYKRIQRPTRPATRSGVMPETPPRRGGCRGRTPCEPGRPPRHLGP